MTDEAKDRRGEAAATSHLSRRGFVARSLIAGLSAAATTPTSSGGAAAAPPLVETDVEVKTPDGTCDAAFIHPAAGAHPGVIVWPDSLGLRPTMRDLGRRVAAEGYSVIVPNLFYRTAKAPVFDPSFDFALEADRERFIRATTPLGAPGAVARDALAYVAFLDAQRQVDKSKKVGTHGYCLGGAYAVRAAAAAPVRVGAAASLHGGFLVTGKPDSPHLLAPQIKARLYFAVAADDDRREPGVKDKIREALAAAGVPAEVEVYPRALHGWCVPDSKAATNKADAERAWGKLMTLYKAAL